VFTGPKNIKQLPHYLAFMDVAILPFKVNALTRSIYPLKINEYLAGGKPVVSTAFSPDIQAFGDVISVANDHDTFIAAVRTALSSNDGSLIQVRRDKASQNSWIARGGQFWEVVENHN
jgi:teichuronic acid biosynthesis glycosyltransferase TuaH